MSNEKACIDCKHFDPEEDAIPPGFPLIGFCNKKNEWLDNSHCFACQKDCEENGFEPTEAKQ